jgi:hypothetical protein
VPARQSGFEAQQVRHARLIKTLRRQWPVRVTVQRSGGVSRLAVVLPSDTPVSSVVTPCHPRRAPKPPHN